MSKHREVTGARWHSYCPWSVGVANRDDTQCSVACRCIGNKWDNVLSLCKELLSEYVYRLNPPFHHFAKAHETITGFHMIVNVISGIWLITLMII